MTNEQRDTETVERREVADPVDPAPAGSQVNVNSRGAGPVLVEETNPLVIVRRVLGLLFGILIALIVLRVLLLALGANAGNALVDGIYSITEVFVAPFRGIFDIDQVSPTGSSEIDIAAIVAIIGWSLIALLITAILRLGDRRA